MGSCHSVHPALPGNQPSVSGFVQHLLSFPDPALEAGDGAGSCCRLEGHSAGSVQSLVSSSYSIFQLHCFIFLPMVFMLAFKDGKMVLGWAPWVPLVGGVVHSLS